MKIVCLGDSLTFGFGVSRPYCWTSLLEKDYTISILNKGMNGDTTGGMMARFQRDVLDERPDMAFLMGGTNDIFTAQTSSCARSNMASMVQQCLAAFVRPVLCIGTPFIVAQVSPQWRSFIDFSIAEPETLAYYDWLRNYANVFSIPLIDFYQHFMTVDVQVRASYYLDGLHMNPQGHEAMALCVKESTLLNS